MRKHKRKLYKQIHGMLFAKATDELCRMLYERIMDEWFLEYDYE